jgi:hypothetical protein
MGRLYVASVLIAISGKGQSTKVVEAPLQPIVPGAWAAWSKTWNAEQSPASEPKQAKTPVASLRPAGSKA